MKRTQTLALTLIASFLAFGALPAAQAQSSSAAAASASAPKEALRKEVYKAYTVAQEFFGKKQYEEALAALRETDAIADLSAYEKFIVTSVRAAIAQARNDNDEIIRTFEQLLASGRMPEADAKKLVVQLGVRYYMKKNYAKAIEYFDRAIKAGDADRAMQTSLQRALYLNGDYPRVIVEIRNMTAADEKAGNKPDEDSLQLWGSAVQQLKDKAGYVEVLEKFVLHYPKKDYWIDLLHKVETKPGFDARLLIDEYRLLFAADALSNVNEYVEFAQMAQQAGFPAEAKKVIEAGYAAGVLGKGSPNDIKAQQKLRDQITKQAADDLKSLNGAEAAAEKPGRDGNSLVNVGQALVQIGQFDKGLALMEKGIAKGTGKRAEERKLHLGIAQFAAGKKDEALKTLAGVGGTDGTAEFARYWGYLILQQK